ncbi:AAA family ATPase [Lyngbya sp. CCAP 1446/10]|uniref:AAA family ATPase n=1 Tax=Microcoleaceae TaxID=1892252 RepID=UPI002238E5C5|nr:AAA family ATPase [Lyngbya sp. CCAP 1446/10]MCW6050857.1 AAA family ATPase [Lyngbya sp. CCAP 1446/10]
MLKEIEIQNFRCFEQIKISGFERVNLIGGKNNAGKTALLEALLLNDAPQAKSLLMLKALRREPSKVMEAMPNRAWDNLFYVLDKERAIVINGKYESNKTHQIEVSIDKSSNLKEIFADKDAEEIIDFLSSNNSGLSVLTINLTRDGGESIKSSVIATSKGIVNSGIPNADGSSPIIPSSMRISGKNLTEAYDRARLDLDKKDTEVLKAFQIIDPAIESVESFSIGEPTLYLRRKGESRLPLSLFGDAINRIADIILKLVNSEHKILLIDEIENGIHYTNHRDFWRLLFRLAVELDTQIFATTHSLEMLEAFADVGLEPNQECSSAYFELAIKLKTNQIIGSRLDLETLNYALERQEGVRGE